MDLFIVIVAGINLDIYSCYNATIVLALYAAIRTLHIPAEPTLYVY